MGSAVPVPPPRYRRKRSKVVWTLVISGLLLGLVGGVMTAVRVMAPLYQPAIDVPGETSMSLEPGRYVVFERTGSRTDAGPFHYSQTDAPRIGAREVVVEGPGGTLVTVTPASINETVTRGSSIYFGVAEFRIREGGSYHVTVNSRSSGEVIVGREMLDSLKSAVVWIAISVVGFLLLVAGVIVAVVRSFLDPTPIAGPPATRTDSTLADPPTH
jgi:hypothetical protein